MRWTVELSSWTGQGGRLHRAVSNGTQGGRQRGTQTPDRGGTWGGPGLNYLSAQTWSVALRLSKVREFVSLSCLSYIYIYLFMEKSKKWLLNLWNKEFELDQQNSVSVVLYINYWTFVWIIKPQNLKTLKPLNLNWTELYDTKYINWIVFISSEMSTFTLPWKIIVIP